MAISVDRVKVVDGALALGFSLGEAVQRALGKSLTAWGEAHGFSSSEVSMCLRYYERRVYGLIRDALAADLGTNRARVDTWIEEHAASLVDASH